MCSDWNATGSGRLPAESARAAIAGHSAPLRLPADDRLPAQSRRLTDRRTGCCGEAWLPTRRGACRLERRLLSRHGVLRALVRRVLFLTSSGDAMDRGFLIDMDGVIYRGSQLIPGADRFIHGLLERNVPFLFLTNNSQRTRRDVAVKLRRMGIEVADE